MREIKRYFSYMGKDIYIYWVILIVTIVIENVLHLLYSYVNKQALNAVEYLKNYGRYSASGEWLSR